MLLEDHMEFRNQYQRDQWYDPNTIPLFFHTTHIENVPSILETGLRSRFMAENIPDRIDIGLEFGFPGSQLFTRLFHSDNTPFLYNRFNEIGGDNLAMLVISADVLDDEEVSLFGMSTHGLAYTQYDYFRCFFMKKAGISKNNEIANLITNYISQNTDNNRFIIFENNPTDFYDCLTENFDLAAQGNGWLRGEVLYSRRVAYTGHGAGQWGNIRAAEVLIFPYVPSKYIKFIACTQNAKVDLPVLPNGVKILGLNNQGFC